MVRFSYTWLTRVTVKIVSGNIEFRVMIVSDWTKLGVLFRFNKVANEWPVFEESTDPAMSAHIPVYEECDYGTYKSSS